MKGENKRHIPGAYTAGLLVIGMNLLLAGCGPEAEEAERAVVEGEDAPITVKEMVVPMPREPSGLVYVKAGFSYRCMECHSGIKAKWRYERPMIEHTRLELRHGTNSFCLNCHHPENRDNYVHYDGSEIPADRVELLCRKCHGPQYRDWQAGIHGRVNGYWKGEIGPQEKLLCTQCHDPHDPAFKPMRPMPAPTYPARAAGDRTQVHAEEPVMEVPHG